MNTENSPAAVESDGLSNPARAIGLILVAVSMFATMEALAKYTSETIRIEMVIWGRYFFHFVGMVLVLPLLGVRRTFHVKNPIMVSIRGLLLLGCTICFFTAISLIPLTDANSIAFVSPLITVALSAFVLREKVGIRRWAAVGIGFVGVLIVLRPGFNEIHWAYFLVLGMATMFSIFGLMTRSLNRTEDPVAMQFHAALVGFIGTGILIFFCWETPSLREWGFLIVIGAIGGVSHQILIFGFRYASASLLAPFHYIVIIWATIYGYFIFDDVPEVWTFAGAALIVTAGLYVWIRERQIKPTPPAQH
ncbi:DMT family transporter [Nisaea sp.]|uniref:DMT family transporter n=1 Tax=Nisaea sp. TaxID=2024842 RepID=UPI002B27A471|nr:DMT family transporter [Nisaea sp.]